ncbi:MAG: hypothetical protein LBM77_10275 [Spirochaetaceae bacterium]|jgi:hypothetical protein|nr:hypothetical protein [Spirochaetaceae bacterium]
MLAERQIVNADVLTQWFTLPPTFAHRAIEVIMYPVDKNPGSETFNNTLTQQVNQVFAKLGDTDKKDMKRISERATATVWETLKNDTW